jgi:hypothetical protein
VVQVDHLVEVPEEQLPVSGGVAGVDARHLIEVEAVGVLQGAVDDGDGAVHLFDAHHSTPIWT